MVPLPAPPPNKPRLVLVGGGWGAFYIAENIDYSKYSVTLVSPRRTSAYTPLLASAAVGLFNFYLAEEPIRSKARKQLHFLKANVTDADLGSSSTTTSSTSSDERGDKGCITCAPAFEEDPELQAQTFTLPYDMLVLAPGCESNTFGTPGVAEHAIFVKNVSDAMRIRKTLFDLLETAALPSVSEARARELLHIAIVGGGPTGIELCAELGDLASHELRDLYPEVAGLIKISVYDVAPHILGAYDASLHEYASAQLTRRGVSVATNTHIERVDRDALYTKEHGRVPYGMLLWATGNRNVALVDEIAGQVRLPERGLKRIQTDAHLRVYKNKEVAKGGGEDEVYDNVFALGDAADIVNQSLPTTAEAAVQKAKYLVDQFNSAGDLMSQPFSRPFSFTEKQMVSYIGSHDGVMTGVKNKTMGKKEESNKNEDGWTGQRAWLAWRRGTLYWNRSWRSRIAIVITWTLNAIFGKELAKI